MIALDDDVFFLLHAAYEGLVVDMRVYPRALTLGLVRARKAGDRRTWLTDRGRALYEADRERRDRASILSPLSLLSGNDEEDENAEQDQKPKRRGRPRAREHV